MSQCRVYEAEGERCPEEGETFFHIYKTTLCPAHKEAWQAGTRDASGRRLVLAPTGDVARIWAGYEGD